MVEKSANFFRWQELKYLARKTVEELMEFRQFSSPKRALGLVSNGLRYLRSVNRMIEFDNEKVEKTIEEGLMMNEADGLIVVYSKNIPMQLVIFPTRSKIEFHPPKKFVKNQSTNSEYKFVFPGPTQTSISLYSICYNRHSYPSGWTDIPDQGYKDSKKTWYSFRDTDSSLTAQYGAIYVKDGQIDIVDYNRLQKLKNIHLVNSDVLMGGNWYMNSKNQKQSYMTSEHMTKRQWYNAMGIVQTQKEEKTFIHITTWDRNVANQYLGRPVLLPDSNMVLLSEIAALMNVMTRKMNWKSWILCGLEYSSGGLRTTNDLGGIAHFSVNY